MGQELRQQVLQYLRSHNTMTLATVGPDGSWAAGLFYVSDDFDLYWLSDPVTRHSVNIAQNPQVAVTIHEDYRDWRTIQGVQMEGRAKQIGTLAQARHSMALYVAKSPFMGDLHHPPAVLDRALAKTRVYHFAPTRVYFIDDTKGLGQREQLELTRETSSCIDGQ